MRTLARRWLSGDERTIGLLLAVGLLTMAFFRLDRLRRDLGVPDLTPSTAMLVVAAALAWWSLLPRGFVWLEPATLTWRDFDGDRSLAVGQRLAAGWVFRQLALGYLVALLAALAAAPVMWTVAGTAVVFSAGLLALGVVRHPAGGPLGSVRPAGRGAVSTSRAPGEVSGGAGADSAAAGVGSGGVSGLSGSAVEGRDADSAVAEGGRGEVSGGAGSGSADAGGGSAADSGGGSGSASQGEGLTADVGGAGSAVARRGSGSAAAGVGWGGVSGDLGSDVPGRDSDPAAAGIGSAADSGAAGSAGRGGGAAPARRPGVGLSRDLVERAVVLLVAVVAVLVRPVPLVLLVAAGGMVVVAVPLLARSGAPGRPRVAQAGRRELVSGWRDRVLRTSGLQFLDVALLFPAARPVSPAASLRTHLNLAWVGVRGRARHLPTAALLALAAVVVRLGFPQISQLAVVGLAGYLAMVPLAGGLGELWRSPGRRRWVVRSDIGLRADHLLVLTGLAAIWAAAAEALAAVGGRPWTATVLLTVPLMAGCAVRTVSRPLPTYDNLGQVDTPFGAMPVRLILQTLRGPDVGVLAVVLLGVLPGYAGAVVVALVVAFCVLR